jgi:hypothetical protein
MGVVSWSEAEASSGCAVLCCLEYQGWNNDEYMGKYADTKSDDCARVREMAPECHVVGIGYVHCAREKGKLQRGMCCVTWLCVSEDFEGVGGSRVAIWAGP